MLPRAIPILAPTFALLLLAIAPLAAQESPAPQETPPAPATPPANPRAVPPAPRPGSAQSPLPALRSSTPAPQPLDAPDRESTPISGKILRYARKLVEKHDTNGDGVLQQEEWSKMSGTPRLADLDGDGIVTVEELAERIASYSRQRSLRLMPAPFSGERLATPTPAQPQPQNPLATDAQARAETAQRARRARQFYVPSTQLPSGLADWFHERDANGDGQITMAEFAETWSQYEAREFARYDLNGDGVITADEFIRANQQRQAEERSAEETRRQALPDPAAPQPATPAP